MVSTTRANRLVRETSPYLLQHAHNPVDWYPWGEEAFRAAADLDRPILLSIGYSACHWCHVMERESFEDPKIAQQMNEHFVCVKVDREERPDVDQLYQASMQILGRGGGWPLTVFLTPERDPFFGGTYFPPEPRHGLPGFAQLLEAVAHAWRQERGQVQQTVSEIGRWLGPAMSPGPAGARASPEEADLREAGDRIAGAIDRVWGGLGEAPKFPMPAALLAALRASRRGATPRVRARVLLTLDRMASGGIYDQLGGGFHRYSVDRRWAVPHFEKMLYDNAQLVRLYAEAFLATGTPRFEEIVAGTIGWLEREMRAPDGGFCASLDADSEGEEGRFYVFDPKAVEGAIGAEDAELLCEHFGVEELGNFEGGQSVLSLAVPLPELARRRGETEGALGARLAAASEALRRARERRPRPGRDDKVLAGWNGLAIGALARAGRAFGRREWVRLAEETADFVLARMRSESGLRRSYKDGQARLQGLLEDYGDLAEGLVQLYMASFAPRYLEAAVSLADEAMARFWDEHELAFLAAARGSLQLPVPVWAGADEAWPSGASTLTEALILLAGITSRPRYLEVAEAYLTRQRETLRADPFSHGQLLCALDLWLDGAATLVTVGPAAEVERLIAEADARWEPTLALVRTPDRGVPLLQATLEGKAPVGGRATVYLCRRFACQSPANDLSALGGATGGSP